MTGHANIVIVLILTIEMFALNAHKLNYPHLTDIQILEMMTFQMSLLDFC